MLRFVDLLARWLRPVSLEKRTSAAKAVKRACIYGTAEAVPFVERRFFPQHFSPCDPDEHFVQDAPSQGLKSLRENSNVLKGTAFRPYV